VKNNPQFRANYLGTTTTTTVRSVSDVNQLLSVDTSDNNNTIQMMTTTTLTTTSTNMDETATTAKTQTKTTAVTSESLVVSYPWSHVQEWALRDNIVKYMVWIPTAAVVAVNQPVEDDTSVVMTTTTTTTSTISRFVLWRSLLQEVPELSGYPIKTLQAKYQEQQRKSQLLPLVVEEKQAMMKKEEEDDHFYNDVEVGILPYLQDYEFTTQGGVCGTIYGLEGVADGSRIETSPVSNVQETLPRGYVQTIDGSVAFEMGRPMQNIIDQRNKYDYLLSMSKSATSSSSWKVITGAVTTQPTQEMGTTTTTNNGIVVGEVSDADGYLVRLGAITTMVLAGATALNMLSHHMTVNVFWV
jgi:hypothetical protein